MVKLNRKPGRYLFYPQTLNPSPFSKDLNVQIVLPLAYKESFCPFTNHNFRPYLNQILQTLFTFHV